MHTEEKASGLCSSACSKFSVTLAASTASMRRRWRTAQKQRKASLETSLPFYAWQLLLLDPLPSRNPREQPSPRPASLACTSGLKGPSSAPFLLPSCKPPGTA